VFVRECPLLRTRNYWPSYFEGTINTWGAAAQDIKVREIRGLPWIIAPLERTLAIAAVGPLHTVMLNDRIQAEIRDHWFLVRILPNGLGLYKQREPLSQ
jgi:hypothetical protein